MSSMGLACVRPWEVFTRAQRLHKCDCHAKFYVVLMAERARSDRKSLPRGRRHSIGGLGLVFFLFCSATSEPAVACFCECAEATSDQYDQVFSGMIISTERLDESVAGPV